MEQPSGKPPPSTKEQQQPSAKPPPTSSKDQPPSSSSKKKAPPVNRNAYENIGGGNENSGVIPTAIGGKKAIANRNAYEVMDGGTGKTEILPSAIYRAGGDAAAGGAVCGDDDDSCKREEEKRKRDEEKRHAKRARRAKRRRRRQRRRWYGIKWVLVPAIFFVVVLVAWLLAAVLVYFRMEQATVAPPIPQRQDGQYVAVVSGMKQNAMRVCKFGIESGRAESGWVQFGKDWKRHRCFEVSIVPTSVWDIPGECRPLKCAVARHTVKNYTNGSLTVKWERDTYRSPSTDVFCLTKKKMDNEYLHHPSKPGVCVGTKGGGSGDDNKATGTCKGFYNGSNEVFNMENYHSVLSDNCDEEDPCWGENGTIIAPAADLKNLNDNYSRLLMVNRDECFEARINESYADILCERFRQNTSMLDTPGALLWIQHLTCELNPSRIRLADGPECRYSGTPMYKIWKCATCTTFVDDSELRSSLKKYIALPKYCGPDKFELEAFGPVNVTDEYFKNDNCAFSCINNNEFDEEAKKIRGFPHGTYCDRSTNKLCFGKECVEVGDEEKKKDGKAIYDLDLNNSIVRRELRTKENCTLEAQLRTKYWTNFEPSNYGD